MAFSAICLQESWLTDDSDLSQYQLPNYNIIHQGKKCSGHGADDTTLVGPLCSFKYDRKSNDYNNISNHINAELNEICKWLSSNKLFLNAPKTKYMLFHFPQRRITDIDLTLKINDLHIDRVHEFNFLGTIIHETLEWTRHIDKVANKISRTLGILNKLKHVLPIH